MLGVVDRRLPGLPDLRRLDADRRRRSCRRADVAAARQQHASRPTGWRCSAAQTEHRRHASPPVAPMMWVSLVSALVIAIGKIAISLLSAFAIVYFRFPFRGAGVLDDLRHADAAGRGAHLPDLQGRLRPRHAQHLRRPDGAADRLGDRDLPVPPVLPDRARRAGRGGAHRRRRADALLQGRAAAAVDDLDRRAVRHPVHLRLEPVPVAAAGDHRREHVPGRDGHQAHVRRRRRGQRVERRSWPPRCWR